MHYIGVDLHKQTLVYAVENNNGRSRRPKTLSCQNMDEILKTFKGLKPFCAVIEASSSYRWLYDLLNPHGDVILAHPLRLRAIVAGRAKTDKLDAALLAKLLRGGLIPEAYIPPQPYQQLRDLTRTRTRLARRNAEAKNELHALLTRSNTQIPFKSPFSKRGRRHVQSLEFGPVGDAIRNELYRRIDHYDREMKILDNELLKMSESFPEVEALTSLYGIGLYSALLIVGEIGEPWRFPEAKKVGAYAGLTARVSQSGGHTYHGHITHRGSGLLRWILVEAAIKLVRQDTKLKNFYTRIRKRSSAKIARVAVARKLACICWVRLMRWHKQQPAV